MLESAKLAPLALMPSLLKPLSDSIRSWHLDPQGVFWFGLLYGIALAYVFVRARRNYLSIHELTPCPAQPNPPDCMVVIPARNEEKVIGRAVRSLPHDSVIVVDDESSDRTGPEAEAAGAGVYRVQKLPKGALGKPHACMAGARAVGTKWMLFADADTWYDEGVLESLINAAELDTLSFLSLHPRMESQSIAEHIVTPYAQALTFAATNLRKSPEAAFDGRCVLVRREAYEFIGGHSVGLNFLVDDLKLAQLALRHRMKIGLARTDELAHARYHEGWFGLWHGIARNAYKLSLLPLSRALMLLLTLLLAAAWLPTVVLTWFTGWKLLSFLLLVSPVVLLAGWYRNPIRALLAPLAIYAMLPIAAHALYVVVTSTRIHWKGREV